MPKIMFGQKSTVSIGSVGYMSIAVKKRGTHHCSIRKVRSY